MKWEDYFKRCYCSSDPPYPLFDSVEEWLKYGKKNVCSLCGDNIYRKPDWMSLSELRKWNDVGVCGHCAAAYISQFPQKEIPRGLLLVKLWR